MAIKKIVLTLLFSISSLFANMEKAEIGDIHNLAIIYESYLLNVFDEKNKKHMQEYLKLIDFNNKNDVILAISRFENEIQKYKAKK